MSVKSVDLDECCSVDTVLTVGSEQMCRGEFTSRLKLKVQRTDHMFVCSDRMNLTLMLSSNTHTLTITTVLKCNSGAFTLISI